MLTWTKEKPVREGWYWVSDDPKTEKSGVYKYTPGVFGVITVMISKNVNMFFAGPITEPRG